MKLFKYLLSLALVCVCMFSISYAQSKKVIKAKPQKGITYDPTVPAAKAKKTSKATTKTVGKDKKCVKCDVHPRKEKTAPKSKTTTGRKNEAVKP